MQGKAALVVVGIDSCESSGRRICYNEITYFIRGSGVGFARKCDSQRLMAMRPIGVAGMTRPMCSSYRGATDLWQPGTCCMRLGL